MTQRIQATSHILLHLAQGRRRAVWLHTSRVARPMMHTAKRRMLLHSGASPKQEALPEARRGRRRRGALRPRRRRIINHLRRCFSIEATRVAALGRRGRRGGADDRHVAQRERGHHTAPPPNVGEHREKDASQSTSTLFPVVRSTALVLCIRLRPLRAHRAARGLLWSWWHGALLPLLLPRR